MSFPEVTDANHMNVRIKNIGNQVYLCVKTDDQAKHTLGTKTISSEMDPEVDFSLYFYTSAEKGETKMVLPVHQNTNVCFGMTPNKEIKISVSGWLGRFMALWNLLSSHPIPQQGHTGPKNRSKYTWTVPDDLSLVHKVDGNEVDGTLEDPMHFEKADNRFFYIWKSGEYYALEAMDGVHRYYFLSLDESNNIELEEVTGSNYPEKTLFSIEEMDDTE